MIINTYQEAFRHKMNFYKFEMMFNTNTPKTQKYIFITHLNIPITNKIQTCIGLPTTICLSKNQTFN